MNNKITLLFLSVFFLSLSCDDEQAAGPGDADTYIKFFGADNEDIAYVSRQTPDGGCVLLGTTGIEVDGISSSKIKIIKVDYNGNQQWQKVYPPFSDTTKVSFIGRSLILSDDGYIVVGESIKPDQTTGNSLLVMEISNTFMQDDPIDSITLSLRDITRDIDDNDFNLHGLDIIQDGNDYRIIANVTNEDEDEAGNLFAKITRDNDNFTYDTLSCLPIYSSEETLVRSLHLANDGDFVFGGNNSRTSISSKTNPVLSKVRPCYISYSGGGDHLISAPQIDYTTGQIIATNNGYAMVGTVSSALSNDVFFVLLDENGAVKPGSLIEYNSEDLLGRDADNDEFGVTIANTSDGGYIIGGSTLSKTAGEEDILLVKTTAAGTVLWSKAIGNANQETATHIQQATDGGYLVFGNTEFGGFDTMFLMKTDKNGDVQ
jgi:hypothetical protein